MYPYQPIFDTLIRESSRISEHRHHLAFRGHLFPRFYKGLATMEDRLHDYLVCQAIIPRLFFGVDFRFYRGGCIFAPKKDPLGEE